MRLKPEETIVFTAGQYVTIGVEREGRLIERPYSVVSSPLEEELELFVELVPEGALTPWLYDLQPGETAYVRRAAKGRFLFDNQSGHTRHFMMATVAGVAPFVSMLRQLAAGTEHGYRVALLQAASVRDELGYVDELQEFARRHPWFTYIPTISRIWLDPGWPGEVGRIEDVARKHLDALSFRPGETTAYACGHPQMIRNVQAIFRRAGFTDADIREEQYWAEKAPAV